MDFPDFYLEYLNWILELYLVYEKTCFAVM